MAQRKTLVLLFLVSNHFLFVLEATQHCPDNCYTKAATSCRCPRPNGMRSPCSWVGNGGVYIFPAGAFRALRHLNHLHLVDNRISRIEPDTFLGLDKLVALLLDKNAISTIPQHAFRGLPRLHVLRLPQNRLTSVPVSALLDLRVHLYLMADLQMNHITTIDKDVARLSQANRLNLRIGYNKLRCDKNLTWFICSMHDLPFISGFDSLKCASPPDLHGTNITTLENNLCQTNNEISQQEIVSKPFSEPSMTTLSRDVISTGPQILKTYPYSETILTKGYNVTEILHNIPVSEYTTQVDYVIILGKDPTINEGVNITYITNMIIAGVVPPLVLVIAVVLTIRKLCRSTDSSHYIRSDEEATDNIEPYAITYADSTELEGHGRNSTTSGRLTPLCNKTPEDYYTIQPYAVAYDQDPGSEIQPYGVAYDDRLGPQLQSQAGVSIDDLEKDDNYVIQPYAVGYPDSPQAPRDRAAADLTPLTNGTNEQPTNVKQPVVQSLSTDDDISPNLENDEPENGDTVGNGKGPYGMYEENEISGMQFKSSAQAKKHSACSTYNPSDGRIQCQTSGQSVLYEYKGIDTGLPHNQPETTDVCY
ncbi:hypothetical protein Bbelb_019650 [Branchiostoma belcheri]|nr:hypothetical protein Bbelb_019650 [Branchiostoma belcheri]